MLLQAYNGMGPIGAAAVRRWLCLCASSPRVIYTSLERWSHRGASGGLDFGGERWLRLVSASLINIRTHGDKVTHVLSERDGNEMRNHVAWRYAARFYEDGDVYDLYNCIYMVWLNQKGN
ncbi:hypothetical protein Bca4012_021327 [Brassica carinata]